MNGFGNQSAYKIYISCWRVENDQETNKNSIQNCLKSGFGLNSGILIYRLWR